MSRGPATILGITLLLMLGIVCGLHSALPMAALSNACHTLQPRHLTAASYQRHASSCIRQPPLYPQRQTTTRKQPQLNSPCCCALTRVVACTVCPLQLAASDAAVHGWPLTTLLPLLDTLASRYSQELVPLLCRPLVQALQHQQQAVAGAMLRVLREDAELDKADQLWEALLLLAYQV